MWLRRDHLEFIGLDSQNARVVCDWLAREYLNLSLWLMKGQLEFSEHDKQEDLMVVWAWQYGVLNVRVVLMDKGTLIVWVISA